jgi:hypothetical protein
MREDFTNATKDLLATRVGFRCSNPGCRQPTSGPQSDPTGTVNIGVAAHITAASPGGPRYDPALTVEQRRAAENGIWLCQTDGKLVDNDAVRYTVECLKAWKARAEEEAACELEQRLHRQPDLASVLRRMERLMPALLAEMRQGLTTGPLRREIVVRKRALGYWAAGDELEYFYEDHDDLDDKLRILENVGLIQDITYNNVKRYRLSEQLAEYLGAP